MKTIKRITAILFVLLLAAGAASAESLCLNGTVEAGVTVPVYAPIGGTVESVNVEPGMNVTAGDTLFAYRTEKIYASGDGTVTGIFVQAGDDAETVSGVYGADLYIEGTMLYSVSSSTSNAYNSIETKFVHTGETVYLLCRTDSSRKGTGIITGVDGSSYSVLVTDGNFIVGDSVTIYRSESLDDKSRLGRGSIARVNPTAVTGSGAVVNVAVKDGQKVRRGDLLLETLNGTYEGYEMTGTSVAAAETGVITSVSAEAGSTVNKGDVVAQIAPTSGMRVEASVSADDRAALKPGDKVSIELESDDSKSYQGTVRFISGMPEEGAEEVTYKAIIDFTPDEDVCFGMVVVVTTEEQPEAAETAPAAETVETAVESAE